MLDKCIQTLRVHPEATADEVRQAFIKQARRYPPEHFPARFAEIKHCLELLNLEDSALEGMANTMDNAELSEVLAMLFPEGIKHSGAADGTTLELDIAAYMNLLQPQQHRQNMLACLERVAQPESYYRR
ncbi:hypothetical protein [Desulfonatronum parangueonense]